MATYPPFSWRDQARHLILAGAVGLGVGFLFAVNQPPGSPDCVAGGNA